MKTWRSLVIDGAPFEPNVPCPLTRLYSKIDATDSGGPRPVPSAICILDQVENNPTTSSA